MKRIDFALSVGAKLPYTIGKTYFLGKGSYELVSVEPELGFVNDLNGNLVQINRLTFKLKKDVTSA